MRLPRRAASGSSPGVFGVPVQLVAVVALGALAMSGAGSVTPELSYELCSRNRKVVLSGVYSSEVRYPDAGPLTTFDAKSAVFTAYPFTSLYPYSIGKDSTPVGVCAVGGRVVGQQSRTLTWDQVKDLYDGDALRISGNAWYVVDGFRVDNVEDGVAPRGTDERFPKDGDGFVMRNLYMTYIRDDCVENDDIAGGVISDSLFDGCYTGVSERPSEDSPQNNFRAPPGETLRLEKVLLRLQAMPGPRGSNNPNILGHGQLFKWSDVANSLVVRDSIFLVERAPNSDSYFPFPPGTVTTNVKIVWLGEGPFTWDVPPGTTVTTSRAVWDSARAEWLTRHGCTSISAPCTKMHNPDPDTTP